MWSQKTTLSETNYTAPVGPTLWIQQFQYKFQSEPFLSRGLFVFAGLTTEGLYRVSGNKTDQDNIQKQFDQGNTNTHTCTESHNLINTLSYLKCNSFHSTSRRLSLFFCRSWFWIIFPRTFECSGVSFETCNQSRRVCVMCAVNSTRRENWFQNLTTQQKCLKRNTWPRGAESNLHTRAGELPGGLLE